jgi:hypothetical protein
MRYFASIKLTKVTNKILSSAGVSDSLVFPSNLFLCARGKNFNERTQESVYFIDKEEKYSRLAGNKNKKVFTCVRSNSQNTWRPPKARARTLLLFIGKFHRIKAEYEQKICCCVGKTQNYSKTLSKDSFFFHVIFYTENMEAKHI